MKISSLLVACLLTPMAALAAPQGGKPPVPPDQPPAHEHPEGLPPDHHPEGLPPGHQPPGHPPGHPPEGHHPDGRAPGMPAEPPPDIKPMETGGKNEWFERTRLFMGTFKDTEIVKGKFPFKNPHKDGHRLKNFEAHCQCVKAIIRVADRRYDLDRGPKGTTLSQVKKVDGKEHKTPVKFVPVGSGESGSVEVHMTLGKFQGIKESSLQFDTTDKKMPLLHLKWQAKGIRYFTQTPGDFFLNDVKFGEQKKFRFQITSEVKPDFKLLKLVDDPGKHVTVNKKQITLPDGKLGWEVTGTFGPKAPAGSGGAALKFKTDLEGREVTMNVVANVMGPVQIVPGAFISLGRIKKGAGVTKTVTLTPNGNFDLKLKSHKFEDLTLDAKYLKLNTRRKGKDLVLELQVLPEAKGRILMRGKMLVTTNVPEIGELKFIFNGILR